MDRETRTEPDIELTLCALGTNCGSLSHAADTSIPQHPDSGCVLAIDDIVVIDHARIALFARLPCECDFPRAFGAGDSITHALLRHAASVRFELQGLRGNYIAPHGTRAHTICDLLLGGNDAADWVQGRGRGRRGGGERVDDFLLGPKRTKTVFRQATFNRRHHVKGGAFGHVSVVRETMGLRMGHEGDGKAQILGDASVRSEGGEEAGGHIRH